MSRPLQETPLTQDPFRSTEAPRPGDPRAGGPRPPATARDVGWALLAVGIAVVTVVQLVALTVALLRLEQGPSGAGLFFGFLITVVWLLTVYWVAMGAWRRSVWGCPFEHDASAPTARRCPRHGSSSSGPPPQGPGPDRGSAGPDADSGGPGDTQPPRLA